MNDSMSQLLFKYLLQHRPYTLLRQHTQTTKNISILVNTNTLLWLALHLRLAQGFYKTQLVDIFAYETPNFSVTQGNAQVSKTTPTTVYNFHNLLNQARYFIFTTSVLGSSSKTYGSHTAAIDSVTELFATSWWLEREVAELHGVVFLGKKDTRNLMLQYGDTSTPFKKSNPSTGFREIYYDSVSDLIAYYQLSFQG